MRIVLRCAEGGTNKQAAAELGVDTSTVDRWRGRFIAGRLDGLADEPRPGRPSSILLDQVEDVIVATLESTPGRDTHWPRASMAARTGLSRSTVGRIWKRFDLKPHLQDSSTAFPVVADPKWLDEAAKGATGGMIGGCVGGALAGGAGCVPAAVAGGVAGGVAGAITGLFS
ncbi:MULTISPECIES: helix-turn-helix domain-containing protein [unclassified Streptomyces]|uniref:helix-turn-helix domain-containing protein n=1 Tax=unclassified Streptomyces TaxID=2593676 RepID=UPI001EF870F6|nr:MULTISPECIES: helix-turn-helix domain-containing protein [unclassified Streptomyces]